MKRLSLVAVALTCVFGSLQAANAQPLVATPLTVNPTSQLTAPQPPDTWRLTLTLDINIAGLNFQASRGAMTCYAMVAVKDEADANIAQINSTVHAGAPNERPYDEPLFAKWLLARAHYLGQEATVKFPIDRGQYHGEQTIGINMSSAELQDLRRNSPPVVVTGCWLSINEVQAEVPSRQTQQPEIALQSNVAHVNSTPYFLVSTPLGLW